MISNILWVFFCFSVFYFIFYFKLVLKNVNMYKINISYEESKRLFRCFFFVTQFPSLITHHSKIPCLFGTITHFPSLNIFHTICGLHTCHSVQFFLFFFSLVPKLTEPSKKIKDPEQTEPVKEEEEKKKESNSQPRRRKEKKKVKRWSEVAAEYCLWAPYVCLITILPLSYELWKLKTAKMCFQFP